MCLIRLKEEEPDPVVPYRVVQRSSNYSAHNSRRGSRHSIPSPPRRSRSSYTYAHYDRDTRRSSGHLAPPPPPPAPVPVHSSSGLQVPAPQPVPVFVNAPPPAPSVSGRSVRSELRMPAPEIVEERHHHYVEVSPRTSLSSSTDSSSEEGRGYVLREREYRRRVREASPARSSAAGYESFRYIDPPGPHHPPDRRGREDYAYDDVRARERSRSRVSFGGAAAGGGRGTRERIVVSRREGPVGGGRESGYYR